MATYRKVCTNKGCKNKLLIPTWKYCQKCSIFIKKNPKKKKKVYTKKINHQTPRLRLFTCIKCNKQTEMFCGPSKRICHKCVEEKRHSN